MLGRIFARRPCRHQVVRVGHCLDLVGVLPATVRAAVSTQARLTTRSSVWLPVPRSGPLENPRLASSVAGANSQPTKKAPAWLGVSRPRPEGPLVLGKAASCVDTLYIAAITIQVVLVCQGNKTRQPRGGCLFLTVTRRRLPGQKGRTTPLVDVPFRIR